MKYEVTGHQKSIYTQLLGIKCCKVRRYNSVHNLIQQSKHLKKCSQSYRYFRVALQKVKKRHIQSTIYLSELLFCDNRKFKRLYMALMIRNGKKETSYSDLQKHESSCLLSDCFCCVSPEPLELQKVFHIFLHPFLKSFQLEQEFFKFCYKIS